MAFNKQITVKHFLIYRICSIKKCMKLMLFILCLLSTVLGIAQFKFSNTIKLPKTVKLEDVSVYYNVGYKDVAVRVTNHQIEIGDSCFNKYAAIMVYDLKNHYYQTFFAKAGRSKISFTNNSKQSFVKNFILKNAISSHELGEEKLYKSAKREIDENDSFVRQYNDLSIENDSINHRSLVLENRSRAKQYEFIRNNNRMYYSLWLFKYNFVNSGYYEAKKLDSFFKKYIKNNFKNYFEISEIENILSERINGVIGNIAPLFTSKDIQGNKVDLNALKGKYVILNFWASWCVPCIEEIPALHEIIDKHGSKKVEIISVNCDNNINNFKNAVVKHNINWINIFNDQYVINKYLKTSSLPKVYLIDPLGKIIYSRTENKDSDLVKLRSMLNDLL